MGTNLAAAELLGGASRRVVIDLTDVRGTVRAMRAERLDAMLDFSSWQRLTAFYSMMAGAKFTAGFRTAGQYRGRGYDVGVEHRDDRHEVENFRALLRAVGIYASLEPKVSGFRWVGAGKPARVVFHLWASGQRSGLREWPEERWVELAGRLAGEFGGDTVFVVTGSPADAVRTEPFVEKLRGAGLRAEAFVGVDGFRGLAAMLTGAQVVVSVNTGVMHLAAIVGAPTVSINGPNRNGRWGPVGPRALGVEAPGAGCGYLHLGFDFDGAGDGLYGADLRSTWWRRRWGW